MRNQAPDARQAYINEIFGSETPIFQQVRESLAEDGKEGINVSSSEAKILQTLIALGNIKTVVEVGTLYGYSALWMAEALPEDGHIYSLELNEVNAKKAEGFFTASEQKNKITLMQGEANSSLEALSDKGPFDMIFIDANKGGYGEYLNWAEINIRSGGLIVGDNSFLFGHVYGQGREDVSVAAKAPEVMRDFNKRLADSSKYYSAILPTNEGMTIAVKK